LQVAKWVSAHDITIKAVTLIQHQAISVIIHITTKCGFKLKKNPTWLKFQRCWL